MQARDRNNEILITGSAEQKWWLKELLGSWKEGWVDGVKKVALACTVQYNIYISKGENTGFES